MLTIQLPDGSSKQFDRPVTPADVAADIGPGLAKAALAAEVDDRIVSLDHALPEEGEVSLRLFTKRDPQALGVMRHSAAHIMARAVMRLWDGVQLAFGPTIDGGFYYDFDLPHTITEDDFPAIEAEMKKVIKEDEPFVRSVLPRDEALAVCRDMQQQFKIEHIEGGLADQETLSFYRQGEFVDLCRGPHVPSARAVGAYKLLSAAGAYWKGDSSNKQLQRLYATAFFDKKELKAHLERIEEAKKRDHRVLGKQLELFTINPLVGSGLILWLPKGAMVRDKLEEFVKEELRRGGYQPVHTPNIARVELYQISGHYPYYAESQFPPIVDHPLGLSLVQLISARAAGSHGEDEQLIALFEQYLEEEVPEHLKPQIAGYDKAAWSAEQKLDAIQDWFTSRERYLLKPMNCPHHIMIYKSKPRSYRELPVRLAEFGTVYRYEQTGELSGMTRVRGFTQDDAHIFCTEDQVAEEFRGCIEMTRHVLKSLGMENYRVRLGFREPGSDKYVGDAASWERAQQSLVEVCEGLGMEFTQEEGEAAFYGPKADFVVRDCLGREWQLGTVQLDYNLPSKERFDLVYIGADNQPHSPVMIHRAPLGSMERFVGVLIEHFAGAFPLWLAPEQVRVLTVSEKSEAYGRQVLEQLQAAGMRAEGDFRAEKLGAKIRDGQLELVPYMLIVGPKDQEAGAVSVRDRIDGDLGAMSLDAAVAKFQQEVEERTVRRRKGAEQQFAPTLGEAAAGAEY